MCAYFHATFLKPAFPHIILDKLVMQLFIHVAPAWLRPQPTQPTIIKLVLDEATWLFDNSHLLQYPVHSKK